MSGRRRPGKRAVRKTVSPSRRVPPPPPLAPPLNKSRPRRRSRLSPPRKNAPPSRRAPAPPPPPAIHNVPVPRRVSLPSSPPLARKNVPPPRRAPAEPTPPARSISPPLPASPPLATRACAQRHAPPSLPSPSGNRLALDGLTEWERIFPRTPAAAAEQACLPVKYDLPEGEGESLAMPGEPKTMRQGEEFAEKIYETVVSGRSLSVALGVDGKIEAERHMDAGERDMLRKWQRDQRLPEADWERLGAEGGEGGDSPLWRERARDLSELYETDCVDATRARAWWDANDEWTSLVTAYGKVRERRQQAERWAAKTVEEYLQAHASWVHANIASCFSNLDRDRFVLTERLQSLNEDDAAPTRVALSARTRAVRDADRVAEVQEVACDETPDVKIVPLEDNPESPQLVHDANGQSPKDASSGQSNPAAPVLFCDGPSSLT